MQFHEQNSFFRRGALNYPRANPPPGAKKQDKPAAPATVATKKPSTRRTFTFRSSVPPGVCIS